MQTLVFNTTTKEVTLLDGPTRKSNILESFTNVSTVKINEAGFYEIMQKTSDETNSAIPVMRVPISNTNMLIEK
jgi:hypothetical protein